MTHFNTMLAVLIHLFIWNCSFAYETNEFPQVGDTPQDFIKKFGAPLSIEKDMLGKSYNWLNDDAELQARTSYLKFGKVTMVRVVRKWPIKDDSEEIDWSARLLKACSDLDVYTHQKTESWKFLKPKKNNAFCYNPTSKHVMMISTFNDPDSATSGYVAWISKDKTIDYESLIIPNIEEY